MSQKAEKYARELVARVDGLEQRVKECESSVCTSQHFERVMCEIIEQSDKNEQRKLAEERRKLRQSQHDARAWKINAMITLVLLGLVAGVALTVAANAEEPEDAGRLPGDDVPATRAAVLPQDADVVEDFENAKIEQALLDRSHKLEGVTISYYCTERRAHICGTGDGVTASGREVTPYVSCAVDPDIIPLGSTVMVDYGDGELVYLRADDVGGSVRGNHIDIAVASHAEALENGIQTAEVYWCGEA